MFFQRWSKRERKENAWQITIINPSKLNVKQVKSRKNTIKRGYFISMSTKRYEVANIISPIENALVVAAPT